MLNSTNEQRVLLALIRKSLFDIDCDFTDLEIDWKQVMIESRAQAVLLLACDSAAHVKELIPAEIFEEWKMRAFRSMMNNMKVQKSQRDMISILSEKRYPYMILKGLAAAYYYPRPELRALGDVDFLIDSDMKVDISDLFVENGYEKSLENHICHVVFKKPGAHLEMHFEPSGIPNGEQGEKVRAFLDKAVYKCSEVKVGNDVFNMPNAMYHGMILALHMQHHQVSEGLGLRHLCDWACFVNKTVDESFWKELLAEFASIGLLTYIKLMTKTCSLYLGSKLPVWAEEVDDQICEDIMNDILASGNFGNKDEIRSKSGRMVSNHGKDGTNHTKVFYLYKNWHMSSAEKNPAVKNNKLRWLFEDIKRAIIYLYKMMKGERLSFIKMIPEADKRKKLYEEFQLFK